MFSITHCNLKIMISILYLHLIIPINIHPWLFCPNFYLNLGITSTFNVRVMRDKRHANVYKQSTLLTGVDLGPSNGLA